MQKTGAAIYPRLTNEHGTVRLSTRKKGSRHRSLGKCSARERSIDLPKWGTHPPFLRPSLVGAKGFFFQVAADFSNPSLSNSPSADLQPDGKSRSRAD